MLNSQMALTDYRRLGPSGVKVSPLCLGTAGFGTDWGSDAHVAERICHTYLDAGGNFIDTANHYAEGRSETLLGQFLTGRRDAVILATKYSVPINPGNPCESGNHRRNMIRTVEESLKRLKTDYIDMLYLHLWYGDTPPDQIMRAFDDLVTAGKILYVGISNAPAWQISRMQLVAELRGWAPVVSIGLEHSLVERTAERDLIPMARELGLAVIPWSPVGGGLLSGKLGSSAKDAKGFRASYLNAIGRITPRNLSIADTLAHVAERHQVEPAAVALAWSIAQDAVTSSVIGARNIQQLASSLSALRINLTHEDFIELDQISSIELGFPHDFLKRFADST